MSTTEGEPTATSRVVADHESREPMLPGEETRQPSSELRQSKWPLGHLTGIPAHLIGLVWIYVSSSALFTGYFYWDDDPFLGALRNLAMVFNFLTATLLLVLQVLWAYKVMILASNDRWQQSVRVRVPFLAGIMIILNVLLIASLVFSISMAVSWLHRNEYYTQSEVLLGCALTVVAVIHYAIILIGKVTRGRIALHFAFERRVSKSSPTSDSVPIVAPYRDDEEAGAQGSSSGAIAT